MKPLTPKLLAALIGSLCLSALPAQADGPLAGDRPDAQHTCLEKTPAGDQPYTCGDSPRGKMLEHSHVLSLPASSSSEREGAEFAGLPGSGLSSEETRIILDNVAPKAMPRGAAVLQDTLPGGTNFVSGRAELTPAGVAALDAIVARVKGKQKIRFEVEGHTDSQRISARLRHTYPDNQALSEARSLTVAAYLKDKLGLTARDFSARGYGESRPIAGNDTPEGMARNRRTELRIWFEEPVAVVPPEPKAMEVVQKKDPCAPSDGVRGGQPFSISVDGQPLSTDTAQVEADRQRCVDVALEKADIQIKYDPMNVSPALNAWLAGTPLLGKPLEFGTYTNYAWWIKKAEIRVFLKGQQTQETPFAVIPVAAGSFVSWRPPQNAPAELGYLLRVYDDKGRFDETALKPVRILERSAPLADQEKASRERLTGYGETSLQLRNIQASGGTVSVSGTHVAAGQTVTAQGILVPVDDKGRFAVRQILPAGPHAVEVAVKDGKGQGTTFRRNLNIADKDWFYFAIADITVGRDHTSGPAQLVTTDTQHYNNETWVDGRGAFYLKGKIKGEYLLTAGADTQEQPLGNLFTNFQAKDPNYLLRQIDPNKYYPVYGDDSTIAEDMPTQGKFFVRLEKGDSSVMWGNFQTAWTGTELTAFSRGLYGANAVWHSNDTTSYGEKKTSVNVFAAEPGTLQSREEFRGTGGSLYYLHHLDLTQGSERLWVEIRDKDSGMALERKPLVYGQDYDFNYLQGRITLRAPLPSVADGSALVQTSAVSGNPVFLVTTYEYAPGLAEVHNKTMGLRASHWFNDNIRVGMTRYHQGESGSDQDLKGLDATLRYKPGTFVRAEVARSKGAGSDSLGSLDGGFSFSQSTPTGQSAGARRVEGAMDLAEVRDGMKGKLSAYVQTKDAGFSGPGASTFNSEATAQRGGAAVLPLGTSTEVAVKADSRNSASQTAQAGEVAVRQKLDAEWGVSAGLRHDQRENAAANASPILSQNGTRNDLIVRVDFNPLADGEKDKAAAAQAAATTAATSAVVVPPAAATSGPATALLPATNTPQAGSLGQPFDPAAAAGVAANRVPGLQYKPWNAYGFLQDTLSRSDGRDANDRGGVGVGYQVNDRLRLGTEVSGGTGGAGGRVSGDYRIDDRSNVYLAYSMETEQADTNYRGRQGTLTSGTHYRLSDQVGMFGETRWTNGAGPQSLTNAFGVDLSPSDRWTLGAKAEVGTVSDPLAGDLRRRAFGLSAAYKFERLKWGSALEYRNESSNTNGTPAGSTSSPSDASVPATAVPAVLAASSRVVWLMKNSLGYQLDPAWRLLGKFNFSRSNSSQGAFYDGDYTEFVAGAAYRPVDNDRWNTLFKYTYFYNLPSPGQVDNLTGSLATLDYTQRSQVLNVDTIYDVRKWLSVGVKYGFRWGQLQDSKTTGDWFSSKADLLVLRSDLHFVKEWDGVVEARRLRAQDAGDARAGFLLAVYRHLPEQHAKIGVGYNFTTFSDNLTDLSYRSRGWFLNALSTF